MVALDVEGVRLKSDLHWCQRKRKLVSVKTDLDQWVDILSHFMVFLFHAPTCTIFFKTADLSCYEKNINTERMIYTIVILI